MAKRVDSELNVGMSKGLRGAVSTPAGYGAAPRSKKYVSKMTHGFFITINSMLLYFKRIIGYTLRISPSMGTRLVTAMAYFYNILLRFSVPWPKFSTVYTE